MPKSPEPDEYGWYRVCDKDTGHVRSIHAAELPHGNYEVLSEAASDVNGDALPPVFPAPAPASPVTPVEPTTNRGQSADSKKESANG